MNEQLGRRLTFRKPSENVNINMRATMISCLGVRVVDHHGKSKKVGFLAIKDRIWGILQSRKGNFLSKADSCYDCTVLVRNNRSASCRSLEEMGTDMHSKKARGIGFRDMKVFNLALLAKRGWRLLSYPDSLYSKVIKVRYFSRSNFLDATLGYKYNYSWFSMLSAQGLLKKGMGWRIGSGKSAMVNSEWIPTGRRLKKPIHRRNHRGMLWSRSIPLPIVSRPDTQVWWPSKDGVFSVQSCYWLGSFGSINRWKETLVGQTDDVWNTISRLKAPHKLKNFALASMFWIASSQRYVVNSSWCERCNIGVEDDFHCLIGCPESDVAWISSSLLA
ncbi:hypothetical protein V2J09_018094 [Rumex salicifolius]